ncbi:4-oxalocrotonate tautomerase DmpI [Paenibacillus sp. CMM36]
MPVITIEAAKLTKEQKRKLVKDLTTSASTIMNIPKQAFFVFVRENELDNIGVAGRILADKAVNSPLKNEE